MRSRFRQAGMSLVEVLVAAAVGLVVALAVTTAIVSSSRQFTIIGGTAAAQSSVQVGLSLLDQGGRAAGAGFYSNALPICPTWNAYNGTAIKSDGEPFMPVRITAGATARDSDTIVFSGGGGAGTRPLAAAPVLAPVLAAGADINIPVSGGFAVGDYAVIGAPGSGQPCTLFEVRNLVATPAGCPGVAIECQQVVRTPNEGINPGPVAFAQRPNFGFETSPAPVVHGPAVISRVGSRETGFRQDAFTVACQSLVRYNAFDFVPPAGDWCSTSPLSFAGGLDAIAGDVVLLQAQYGVSSAATPTSNIVAEWVDPSDAAWSGTPAVDDIARIKAVRVVMVSRSREPAGEEVSAPCTNGAGVVNQGPCSFEDARAPVVDLSAVPVPAGRSWRNFRYRAHTAVIPLRAVIWSGSS
ncbi:MAG TPA: PilW family protein [Ramlibacter sp.]